jgi:hypothetical protein
MTIFSKLCLLVSAAAAFVVLSSCGGSGSGGGGGSNSVAPAGMDTIIIRLNNSVTFEFLSDNGSSGGFPETGTIRYDKNSATTTTFTNNMGGTITLPWPNEFSFARYEYTRVGSQTGSIRITGVASAPGTVLSGIENNGIDTPAIFTILFNTNGTGFISSASINMQLQIVNAIYNGDVAATLSKSSGGQVEEGFDPYNPAPGPRPSRLTSGIFGAASGDNSRTVFMAFDDGNPVVDDPELSLFFNNGGVTPPPGSNRLTDAGVGNATTSNTLLPPGNDSTVYEFGYELRQPLSTDNVVMILDYDPSGSPTAAQLGGAVPSDQPTYTLTFTSDESGTFTGSDGSSGIFNIL